MPRGSSPKRERQYEHIKDSYEKRGQGRRAEEIAARTVNKERAEAGETKGSRKSSSRSKSSSSSSKPSASRSSSSKPSSSKSSSSRSSRPSASRGSSSSGRTRQQRYDEARRKGVEGRSSMNKAQLERALSR